METRQAQAQAEAEAKAAAQRQTARAGGGYGNSYGGGNDAGTGDSYTPAITKTAQPKPKTSGRIGAASNGVSSKSTGGGYSGVSRALTR